MATVVDVNQERLVQKLSEMWLLFEGGSWWRLVELLQPASMFYLENQDTLELSLQVNSYWFSPSKQSKVWCHEFEWSTHGGVPPSSMSSTRSEKIWNLCCSKGCAITRGSSGDKPAGCIAQPPPTGVAFAPFTTFSRPTSALINSKPWCQMWKDSWNLRDLRSGHIWSKRAWGWQAGESRGYRTNDGNDNKDVWVTS